MQRPGRAAALGSSILVSPEMINALLVQDRLL